MFDIFCLIIIVLGFYFFIYVVINFLLLMFEFWVECGNRDGSYWESIVGNFKYVCGFVIELVVEELG